MKKLVTFALMLFVLVTLAACGVQAVQPQPRAEQLPVDTVEVSIAESLPVQPMVRFKGALPNGCYSLGEITQSREGNVITVDVKMNNSGAEACTMMLEIIDKSITLQGDFPAGEYTVIVNGMTQNFTI